MPSCQPMRPPRGLCGEKGGKKSSAPLSCTPKEGRCPWFRGTRAYLSSRKYARPREAGGWFSRLFLMEEMTSTMIVTT